MFVWHANLLSIHNAMTTVNTKCFLIKATSFYSSVWCVMFCIFRIIELNIISKEVVGGNKSRHNYFDRHYIAVPKAECLGVKILDSKNQNNKMKCIVFADLIFAAQNCVSGNCEWNWTTRMWKIKDFPVFGIRRFV